MKPKKVQKLLGKLDKVQAVLEQIREELEQAAAETVAEGQ